MPDARSRRPLWGTVAACLAGLTLWFVLRSCDSGPEVELEAPAAEMQSAEQETIPRRREPSEPVVEAESPVPDAPKIRFLVEDEGGNPLAGVRLVSIQSRPWRRASHRVQDELGRTDENGAVSLPRAEVEALYADQIWIAVVAQTYRHDFITTLPPENERRVVLVPQDYFEMTFLDPAGNPIPGVAVEMGRVRLMYDRAKLSGSGELLASPGSQFGTARLRSDENGRVRIPCEGSGWRICHVRHPHYVDARYLGARSEFAVELPSPPRIFEMAEIYGAAVKLEGGLKFEEQLIVHSNLELEKARAIDGWRRTTMRRNLGADRLFLRVGNPRSKARFKTLDHTGTVVAHELAYRAISEGIETSILKSEAEVPEEAETEKHQLRIRFRFGQEWRDDFKSYGVYSKWMEEEKEAKSSVVFRDDLIRRQRENVSVPRSQVAEGLPPGRYRIRDLSGCDAFEPVVVELDQDRDVTIDLSCDFGEVWLSTRVSGHSESFAVLTYEWFRLASEEVVRRVGWTAGESDETSRGIRLQTGDYELRVYGPGVERATRRVHVKSGRNRIEVDLLERLTFDDRDFNFVGKLE